MTHSDQNGQEIAVLLEALKDRNRPFAKEELETIINDEFFNDEKTLNTDIVDAAVVRMLLLEGTDLNETTLQQSRESMICGVLKKILKPKN